MLRNDLLRSGDIAIQIGNVTLPNGTAAATGREVVNGVTSPVIQIGFSNSF